MENPIEMDDLGVPPFWETPNWIWWYQRLIQRIPYWKNTNQIGLHIESIRVRPNRPFNIWLPKRNLDPTMSVMWNSGHIFPLKKKQLFRIAHELQNMGNWTKKSPKSHLNNPPLSFFCSLPLKAKPPKETKGFSDSFGNSWDLFLHLDMSFPTERCRGWIF